MSIPQAPTNLFVNRNSNYSVIRWDKVLQDIGDAPNYIPQYTTIIAYYVYKTSNPAALNWTFVKKIITNDNYSDKDIFCLDFTPGNFLYKVYAENSDGIGLVAISFGIAGNVQTIVTVQSCLWDIGYWDECLWAP